MICLFLFQSFKKPFYLLSDRDYSVIFKKNQQFSSVIKKKNSKYRAKCKMADRAGWVKGVIIMGYLWVDP